MRGLDPRIHLLRTTLLIDGLPGQAHGCPARFLLGKVHGIDSNGVQSFATQLDMKRISAVPHTNTVFRDILKLVPWAEFDKLVKNHGSDDLVRSFTTKRQLLALLYGQLSGASSLREIEASMTSHRGRLYHAGGRAPARSTFADANRTRNPVVFSGLFMHMLGMTTRGLRRKLGDAVRLIDSTGLHLAGAGTNWARFSADVCGAKAHVIYDPELGCPIYHMITAATVNDITAAKAMPIEAGATYVFDLGYYDYGWWASLDEAGCRIVTRFKKNTPLHAAKSLPVEPATGILSDRIGFLPGRQAKNRKNPMQGAVREIVVAMETGGTLRILSNDLDAPAKEIADLYKQRWQIELFFRVMKQTLKITHFIGRSENAVRIQIAIALIAFLLLRMAQLAQKAVHSPLEFARLVRTNLMHRRPIDNLLEPRQSVPINQNQLKLALYFQ
jgi:IS4 transposase